MVVEACPAFAPNTFQNWEREIKLWISGKPGETVTQLLSKPIRVLPLAVKTEALIYMGQSERIPADRPIAAIMDPMGGWYARTDSERARAWLSAFADFKREAQGNCKDFWARFARCVAKLEALGMPMGEKVVCARSIRALRLPDGQLPIALSEMETRPDRFSVSALREITIRMYATHKTGGDPTEVYDVDTPVNHDARNTFHAKENDWGGNDWACPDEDWYYGMEGEAEELALEDGTIMSMKRKKPTKPQNAPGVREASRRGAVGDFSHIPNLEGNGAGKSVRLRCGDPPHRWRECPHPFR